MWSRVPRYSDPRITALAKTNSNCKRQTSPLVRDSAPHQQTRKCLTVIKIWSWVPDGCFIPRQTGRLTVGRNIRLETRESVKIWSELVRGLPQFICCELLLWEADSWARWQVRDPRGRGTSTIWSRNRATASKEYNGLRRPNVSYSDLWSVVTSCISVQ
jgi:hypothetical protein